EDNLTKSKLKKIEKVTKVTDAKKTLKKNLKVNTKTVFADDGKALQQWPPVQNAIVDVGDDDDQTGIDLTKARQRLTEEDKYDKEAYRQKIKEKHREKRLKEKAARKANKKSEEDEEEGVAYLAQDDSGDEVDLSALPDPDKYRGDDDDDEDDQDDDSGEDSSSDHEEMPPRKRTFAGKSKDPENKAVSAKKRKTTPSLEEQFEPLNTGLSLTEDEELVLHLLSNKN
ncbi:hypothetical protein GDO78_000504, partial [Eleutherodactylus coqui]